MWLMRRDKKCTMEMHKRAPSRIERNDPFFVTTFRDHAKIGDLALPPVK